MASERLKALYKQFRSKPRTMRTGFNATDAYHDAITQAKWDALESMGFVQLRAEPDDDGDLSFLDDWTGTRGERASAKAVRDQAERDGIWGSIAEFRTDPDSDDWEEADSCWGHIGYDDVLDPHQNPYIIDHMDAAIDQFKAAWKAHVREQAERSAGLCAACHGTGRSR